MPQLVTRTSFAEQARALGLAQGNSVLVHSSLKSLGWVCGGPMAVIQALMEVLTPNGLLMMPTFSTDLSEPSEWVNPPAPSEWWQTIRDTMPPYDPVRTPTREMGSIPELFRSWPNVYRSGHPSLSFAAWGMNAADVIANHSLDYPLGDHSPLAQLYERGSKIMLIGVGYDRCTSLHLAEHRLGTRPELTLWSPITREGRREWVSMKNIHYDDHLFPKVGEAFEETGEADAGHIGDAFCRLIPMRRLVDFGQEWFKLNDP